MMRQIKDVLVGAGVPGLEVERIERVGDRITGTAYSLVMLPRDPHGQSPCLLLRKLNDAEKLSPLPVVLFGASRYYGYDIEDSLVVTRLSTFAPMFSMFVNSDPQNLIRPTHTKE